MLDRYEPALDDLRTRLRSALEIVASRAAELPQATDLLAWLCEFVARDLALWTSNTDEWMNSARTLLARHFATDDARARVRVRLALLDGDSPSIQEHLFWQQSIGERSPVAVAGFHDPHERRGRFSPPSHVSSAMPTISMIVLSATAQRSVRKPMVSATRIFFRPRRKRFKELSERFGDDKQTAGVALAMFSKGLSAKSRRQPPAQPGEGKVEPALPLPDDLPVARLRWRTSGTFDESDEEAQLQTESLVWAEESIWAYIHRRREKRTSGSIVRIGVPEIRTLERFDLPPLPETASPSNSFRLLVTSKRLIVLAMGRWIAFAGRPRGNWHVESVSRLWARVRSPMTRKCFSSERTISMGRGSFATTYEATFRASPQHSKGPASIAT
jgi:hypothetical protein